MNYGINQSFWKHSFEFLYADGHSHQRREVPFAGPTEIRLETQYPGLNVETRDPKWKFIGAWSTHAVPRGLTHGPGITNIAFRMRVLFHFHAGFTGRRDYQSRGRAHSFLNLRSLHGLRSRRGLDVIEDSATVKIAMFRSYRGGKVVGPVA